MGTPITARLAVAWAALKGTLAPGASAPLPHRYTQGRFADWGSQIGAYMAQYQPIQPDEAREGRDNSVVSICLNWIITNWHKATPRVGVMTGDEFQPLAGSHWLTDLLANPALDMGRIQFFSALQRDYVHKGMAYAHKIRTNSGKVVALEYLPARFMRAMPDEKTGRLSYFRYIPYGMVIDFQPEEIVYIQYGVDPDYPLNGISPIAAQYREIVTDNSYSDYAAGLARNGGIPPLVFTPRAVSDGTVAITPDDAKYMSEALNEKMRQEPGRTIVTSGALDMHKTGVVPNEMALTDVRAMPETRIPAALGLSALLLQLYTGVQKSTFTNLIEARISGWEQCLIPMMEVFAEAFTRQLLWDDKQSKTRGLIVRYDTSEVDELSDDLIALRDAARADVAAGIMTVDEARAEQGLGPSAELAAQSRPLPAAPSELPASAKSMYRALKVAQSAGDIYSVADMYRRRLLRHESEAIDELATEWAKTLAATETRLRNLVAYLESAEADGVAIDERVAQAAQRLSELIPQMENELAQLSERGAAIIENGQRAMILSSVDSQAAMAKTQGMTQWNKLPAETFENLLGLASSGSPLASVLDDAFGDYAGAMRSQLLAAVAQGRNPKQVAATMAAITGTSRARAETIARTEMLRASREASRQTYKANRDVLDGWVRLSAADSRTCPACWALHGTKQLVDDVMPSHPNCRCTCVPLPKSSLIPDSAASQIPMGEDLFNALPEEEQREILGPGRFEQWQNGASFSSFAVLESDPEWGPTVSTRPVSKPAVEGYV